MREGQKKEKDVSDELKRIEEQSHSDIFLKGPEVKEIITKQRDA